MCLWYVCVRARLCLRMLMFCSIFSPVSLLCAGSRVALRGGEFKAFRENTSKKPFCLQPHLLFPQWVLRGAGCLPHVYQQQPGEEEALPI